MSFISKMLAPFDDVDVKSLIQDLDECVAERRMLCWELLSQSWTDEPAVFDQMLDRIRQAGRSDLADRTIHEFVHHSRNNPHENLAMYPVLSKHLNTPLCLDAIDFDPTEDLPIEQCPFRLPIALESFSVFGMYCLAAGVNERFREAVQVAREGHRISWFSQSLAFTLIRLCDPPRKMEDLYRVAIDNGLKPEDLAKGIYNASLAASTKLDLFGHLEPIMGDKLAPKVRAVHTQAERRSDSQDRDDLEKIVGLLEDRCRVRSLQVPAMVMSLP